MQLDPVRVFGALGHAGRLQIVEALAQRDHCVHELVELVGSSWGTVSRHLAVLREAGVVRDERRGSHIHYSLALNCVASFTTCLRAAARGQRVEVRACCK